MLGCRETPTRYPDPGDCIEFCKLLTVAIAFLPLLALAAALLVPVARVVCMAFSVQGLLMMATFSGCAFTPEPARCTADVVWHFAAPEPCRARINDTHYGPVSEAQTV